MLKRKGHGRKPDRLDIRPFDRKLEDFKGFSMDLESKFDYYQKSLRWDMDKIRLVMPLLEGDSKQWYETIHIFVNPHAAVRAGVVFNNRSSYCKWNTFF